MLFVGKQGAFFMNKIRQNKAKQGKTRQNKAENGQRFGK